MITFVKTKTKQLCGVCAYLLKCTENAFKGYTSNCSFPFLLWLGNGIWKDGRYEGEILVLLYYFCFV